jgi:nucleotide-binding universal stress UspA family protein
MRETYKVCYLKDLSYKFELFKSLILLSHHLSFSYAWGFGVLGFWGFGGAPFVELFIIGVTYDAPFLVRNPSKPSYALSLPMNADEFSAAQVITTLTSSAQDAPESASDQEHWGHRLQPQGRILVQSLSKLLCRSELTCWDLLQRIDADAPGATDMELETLAVAAHLDDRSGHLRVILDVLKRARSSPSLKALEVAAAKAAEKQAAEVKKAAAAAAANAKVEEGSSAGRDSLTKCLFDELHFLLRACRDYELTATEEKCGNAAVVENRRRDEVNLICLCIFYRCLCDDSAVSVAFFFDRSSRATLTKSNDILKKGESKRGAAADLWQLAALHGPPECNHVLFLSMLVALIRENEPAASTSVSEWAAAGGRMAADARLKALFDRDKSV